MSNSIGAVKFKDGTIMYYEYYGTIDTVNPILRDLPEEVYFNWRKIPKEILICNHEKEDVEIFSSYGNGFTWKGGACKICKLITSGREPDYDTEVEGYPDWVSFSKI